MLTSVWGLGQEAGAVRTIRMLIIRKKGVMLGLIIDRYSGGGPGQYWRIQRCTALGHLRIPNLCFGRLVLGLVGRMPASRVRTTLR